MQDQQPAAAASSALDLRTEAERDRLSRAARRAAFLMGIEVGRRGDLTALFVGCLIGAALTIAAFHLFA